MLCEKLKNDVLGRLRSELPSDLSYHDVGHTMDVMTAVAEIARREGIDDGKTLCLLETAALFHDLGYVERYEDNERIACRMAEEALPGYGYSDEEIKVVSEMIMSTKIPQAPKMKLAEILCDADLDYLGSDDFAPTAEKLRRELAAHGKVFAEDEWLEFEIGFLESHKYFTPSERKIRESGKRRNLEKLKALLADVRND